MQSRLKHHSSITITIILQAAFFKDISDIDPLIKTLVCFYKKTIWLIFNLHGSQLSLASRCGGFPLHFDQTRKFPLHRFILLGPDAEISKLKT